MAKIVECIPNFSEGRRKDVVNAIAAEAKGDSRVVVLGCEMDSDHNRSVLTFAGMTRVSLKTSTSPGRRSAGRSRIVRSIRSGPTSSSRAASRGTAGRAAINARSAS